MTATQPIIELHLRNLASDLSGIVMLQAEEVADSVQAGVEAAARSINVKTLAEKTALNEMERQVRKEVETFFALGDGRHLVSNMFRAAMQQMAEKHDSEIPTMTINGVRISDNEVKALTGSLIYFIEHMNNDPRAEMIDEVARAANILKLLVGDK